MYIVYEVLLFSLKGKGNSDIYYNIDALCWYGKKNKPETKLKL